MGSGAVSSLSLAACLLTRSGLGAVDVTASGGWRAGLAWLSATPASILRTGRSAWRAWSGPVLAVDLTVRLGGVFLVAASAESGYAVVPARGSVDSVDVVALDGAWLSGFLSLGTAL